MAPLLLVFPLPRGSHTPLGGEVLLYTLVYGNFYIWVLARIAT